MDASDLGMEAIKLRNMISYLNNFPKVDTLLLTGGNSKNGPEYHLRRYLKLLEIPFKLISTETPKIHSFNLENRKDWTWI